MPKQEIKLGSQVKWTSQSGGFKATKVGVVVHVLPAGAAPFNGFGSGLMADLEKKYGAKAQGGTFMARKHESYIVLVRDPKRPRAAPKLYWPIVSKLKLVKSRKVEAPAEPKTNEQA